MRENYVILIQTFCCLTGIVEYLLVEMWNQEKLNYENVALLPPVGYTLILILVKIAETLND